MEKDQQMVAGFLVFIGVTALILGFVQTRQGINVGLGRPASSSSLSLEGRGQANGTFEGDDPALKAKDTDKDGLNDYDELKVYRTSPYIADSDGDSFPDGDEVKKATDPNCPEGKTCAGQEPLASPSTDLFSALKPPSSSPFAGSLGANVQLGANATPAQLRAVLQQSGQIAPDLLAKISDEDLLATWRATTGGASGGDATPSSIQNSSSGTTPSVADMRTFLKSQGIGDEILNKVTDDQLMKIFQENMNKK